ncbi:MAG: hypothetical protein H8D42_04230 [Candidatus Marinimicrobia bacterium]|nr:hypothetical protein [Candidatus Neomarinimicrobiota bacterium]
MISKYYKRIQKNVELKFSDILQSTELIRGTAGRIRKLRLYLIDNTFVDIWYSPDGSYSYHWEQRAVRNAIYRHDNAPHQKWQSVSTFPKHCHDGSQLNVTDSFLPDDYEKAIEEFLCLVREKMASKQIPEKKQR